MRDRQHLELLKASEQRVAELLAKVETLETQNAKSANASQQQKEALKALFRENTERLTAQEWFKKGASLWNGNAFDAPQKAVEHFDRAIELDTRFAVAYHFRGFAYSKLKQPRRAIEDYNRAIELDPGALAYHFRGMAYVELKQPRRAIEDLNRAIELDPGLAQAYLTRGVTYAWLKQPRRAIEDLDRAVEVDPGLARAHFARGLINFLHLRKQEKACRDWRRACKLGHNASCKESEQHC